MIEVTKSPKAVTNARLAPASSAGRSSGRVTRRRVRHRPAPSVAAASSSDGIEGADAGQQRAAGDRQIPYEIGERKDPEGADQHEAAGPRRLDAEGGGQRDGEHGARYRPWQRQQPLDEPPAAHSAPDGYQSARDSPIATAAIGGGGRQPQAVQRAAGPAPDPGPM